MNRLIIEKVSPLATFQAWKMTIATVIHFVRKVAVSFSAAAFDRRLLM
jgi:hypothetical protein